MVVIERLKFDRATILKLASLAVALTLPFLPFTSEYLLHVCILIFLYMVLALGLNVVPGFNGLLDLGYVGFYGIGAYTAGLLTVKFGLSYWLIIPLAAINGAIWGVLLGAPTLRLTGDYFAIVTFGFSELVVLVITNEIWLTRGPLGLPGIEPASIDLSWFGGPVWYLEGDTPGVYYLILALVLLTLFVMNRIQNSRLGRAWFAIRDDELAAVSCGINLLQYKVIAFAISAAFGALGGSFYARWVSVLSPTDFVFWESFLVLCMIVLGGLGNIWGVLVGAAALVSLGEILRAVLPLVGTPHECAVSFLRIDHGAHHAVEAGRAAAHPRGGGANEGGSAQAENTVYESIAQMKPILDIEELSKNFGGVTALSKVSFSIFKGQILGLIGPNGAGKTTLFNCVAGIDRPTSGRIIFHAPNGPVVSIGGKKPEHVTALGIARTFQNIRLFDTLTVLDNVKIGRHCRTRSNFFGAVLRTGFERREEREIEERSREILSFVGLTGRYDEVASSLPYGDQRRLEIARALATDPVLLMLDEPAAGMNPMESRDLMNLILRIRDKGITVLLIEHDMKVVMGICERVVVINYGSWLAEAGPHEVAKDPKVIEAYLGRGAAGAS